MLVVADNVVKRFILPELAAWAKNFIDLVGGDGSPRPGGISE